MSNLISRQAAIDEIEYELEMINSALDSLTLDFNARNILYQRRGEAREILNSIQTLPSIDAEPIKHGRWIDMQYPLAGHTFISCSECGEKLDIDGSYKSIINYCPNCGAKMDGKESENE